MKILITGVTGFVGQNLAEYLSKQFEIIGVSRRLWEAEYLSDIRLVDDLNADTDWTGLLEDIDVVIHLAARAHVMDENEKDPLAKYREVNRDGSVFLAKAAAEQGVKRFIFFSSVKVFGEGSSVGPYSVDQVPHPVDPYGISKLEAEKQITELVENSQMELVIIRPPAIYGAGVKGNVPRLAKLVQRRVPLPFGCVNNRRSMVSIGNLCRWTEHAISDPLPQISIVVIGDLEPVSTRGLVSGIAAGMGFKALQIPVPITLMNFAAKLLKREALSMRLFGDLEILPTFERFPGISSELRSSKSELMLFGRIYRQETLTE